MHLIHLHHLTSTMASLVSDFQKKTLRSQRSRFGVAIDHWPKEWAIWVDRPVHSADVWLEHMCSLSWWKSPVIARRVRSAWNPDSSFEVLDQTVMSSIFVNWSCYPSTLFGSLNRAGHHLPAHSKNCNCTHLANTKTRDAKRKYCTKICKNYVSYPTFSTCPSSWSSSLSLHIFRLRWLGPAAIPRVDSEMQKTFGIFLKFSIGRAVENPEIPDSLMRSTRALGFFLPRSSLRSLLNPHRTSFTNIYYLSHDVAYITW